MKKKKAMGRPSLGVELTSTRLSPDAKDRIRALVGDRGMAQFIREAVDNELDRREKSTSPRKP